VKTLRFPVMVTAILVVAAFFAGTLVRASAAPGRLERVRAPDAPALTAQEWAAISGAEALLLDDDAPGELYLPLIVH
jgi:hypothetical protein